MKMKKTRPYLKPDCKWALLDNRVSLLAESPNGYNDTTGIMPTDGVPESGDAGNAHTKSWRSVWEEEE